MVKSYKRSLRKPIELLLQVILYREAGYFLSLIIKHDGISLRSVLGCALPANYFVIFYCVLFFLSPFINKLLDMLRSEHVKRLLVLMVLIFSIYSTGVSVIGNIVGNEIMGLDSVGMYGNQSGYTIVNFTLMYIIGACIGKFKLNERFSKNKLLLVYLGSAVAIFIWSVFEARFPDKVNTTGLMYCNPFVILEAVSLFMLFLNIDMGSDKVINKLATGVFSVFLLHGYLIGHLRIEQFVQENALIMIIHMIVCTVGMFLVCTVCHFIYKAITTPIYNAIFGKWNPVIVDLENVNET